MDTQQQQNGVLAPASRAVVFALPADAAAMTPAEACAVLGQVSDGIRLANAAAVYYRIILGRQLALIRDKGLWRTPELQAEGVDPPRNWDTWTREHFPALAHLSRETAYAAMQIAGCKAISSLDEPQLRSFETLANAVLLARLERQKGLSVAHELLPQAMELSLQEFKQAAGVSDGLGQTTTVTPTPGAAVALDAIGRRLKDAEQETINAIAGLLDGEVASVCGDNPGDIASFVLASLQHELQAQMGE